jgi:ankyrin repeat protein
MRTPGIREREFVMSKQLPPQASLEQLKHQAKDLLKAHRAGDPGTLQRMRESHPELKSAKPKLADAQLVIAREYGFASWPRLKQHLESTAAETADPFTLAHQAFERDDAKTIRQLLRKYPALRARINEPIGGFGGPPITHVKSAEMLDVLLEAGADINAVSHWWAGGFALVHSAKPELARHAIRRGAKVDIHAAARLGMIDEVRRLLEADPQLVHARGGDGQTPLHFASTVEIADCLLDRGAKIDARDVDHESTPAQYMLDHRQEIARFLVQRGCATDLLMAAALGDEALVRKHLDADPECIHMRVSEEFFPMVGGRSGGTIYQWTLGWHVSAHQVARKFGHERIFELLMERSPRAVKLITACWLGDEALFAALANGPSNVQFSPLERRQLVHAARNNDTKAARMMLNLGLPVTERGQHNATPLHWAAWHGNTELVREFLRHNPPLEDAANDFNGTPLRWAIHGSENGWHRETGDYGGTVTTLLQAGASRPAQISGTEAVRRALSAGG